MNRKTLFLMLCISFFAQCSRSQQSHILKQTETAKNTGMALVELFTSEGCSSCPPADALMPQLKEAYKGQAIFLSFHVDYWDRLGWKDPYSSSEYSRRQNQYATAFNADNVYTPQAVVNGTTQTTGGNRVALTRMIDKAIETSSGTTLTLTAKRQGDQAIMVVYKTSLEHDEVIHLALVQVRGQTNVRRGENSGRILNHYNIVRELKTSGTSTGSLSFKLPDSLSFTQCHVVAFVQHTGNMHILNAREINVE